jgi:crossover junction endodeoxyribonuclease RuvC
MYIAGVDTSLRSTGLAVIDFNNNTFRYIYSECIKSPAKWAMSKCLGHIYHSVSSVISEYKPEQAAVEGVFYCKNVKTAVVLGEARGAVLTACYSSSLPVYEYSPRLVKQAITGAGSASKQQVRAMVARLLNIDSYIQEDISDALAIAICHAHRISSMHINTLKTV